MKGIKGKTICVFSPKGGTGKTTLVSSLGAVASLMGKKVLLVDADIFNGTLSMFINEEINKTLFNLTDDLYNNRYKSITDYVYKYNENIDILCAPKDPRQGSKIESNYIDIIVERACNSYDIVVVDTYTNLDEFTVSVLDISDMIFFVINNDMFTLKNMKNVISIFTDNNIDNYRIILNSSIDYKYPYFTASEMKKIIGTNIDYTISKDFFMKEFTSYIFDSKIPLLESNNMKKFKKDINNIELMIKDALEVKNEKE